MWRCGMPRRTRIAPGEIVYHTLNRANGGNELFHKPEDYSAFERIMISAMHRTPIQLPAYCHAQSLAHGEGLMVIENRC